MSATFDHYEIPTASSERLAAFLEEVFGWAIEAEESQQGRRELAETGPTLKRYRRLVATERGSGAAFHVGLFEGSSEILERAVPVVRLAGEALEPCLERVVAAGGRVVLKPMSIPSSGRWARFEDPAGNEWGLWEPSAQS